MIVIRNDVRLRMASSPSWKTFRSCFPLRSSVFSFVRLNALCALFAHHALVIRPREFFSSVARARSYASGSISPAA